MIPPAHFLVLCFRIDVEQEQELELLNAKLEESESGRRTTAAVKEALEKVRPTTFGSRLSTHSWVGDREAL